MELVLSSTEIWQLAVIKLLFYLFIAIGIFCFFYFRKPIVFILLISGFLSASYAVLVWHSQLPWWGLQGDEVFVTAFLVKVISGRFFSDFFHTNFPPFYPALYYWLIGGIGYFLKISSIKTAQLGVAITLFLTPLIVYLVQKYYSRFTPRQLFAPWQAVLTTALVFIVYDWTAIILKPYEFFSAVLIVLWAVFLLNDFYFKNLNYKRLIIYGIFGGILFLFYYFWFLPVALAILFFKIFSQVDSKYFWPRIILTGILILIVSLPFILPLLLSYLPNGSENWVPLFFIAEDLNLYLPFLSFSIFGFLTLVGLISIIFYWRYPVFRALGFLLLAGYFWQFLNLISLIFWQVSILPGKPFLFLGGAILMIAAGFGLSQFILEKIPSDQNKKFLFILGWIILATQLLGGTFIDSPAVRHQLIEIKRPLREEFLNLIDELKKIESIENLTILSSGIPQISAYLPLNYYISYNMHFSHPAANFIKRYEFLADLAIAKNADEFYQKFKNSPYEPINALLFFKTENYYPMHFWLDYYPLGGVEQELKIPAHLISEQYFAKVFEDKYFVFYKTK